MELYMFAAETNCMLGNGFNKEWGGGGVVLPPVGQCIFVFDKLATERCISGLVLLVL